MQSAKFSGRIQEPRSNSLSIFEQFAKSVCPICQIFLFKLQIIFVWYKSGKKCSLQSSPAKEPRSNSPALFVQFVLYLCPNWKYISPNWKSYLSDIRGGKLQSGKFSGKIQEPRSNSLSIFEQIAKSICPICQIFLSKLQNV